MKDINLNNSFEDNSVFRESIVADKKETSKSKAIKFISNFLIRNFRLENTDIYIAEGVFLVVMGLLTVFCHYDDIPNPILSCINIIGAIFFVIGSFSLSLKPLLTKFIRDSVNVKSGQKLYALSYTDVIEVKIVEFYVNASDNIIYWCEYMSPFKNKITRRYFKAEELFIDRKTAERRLNIIYRKRVEAFKNIIENSTEDSAEKFLNSQEFICLANEQFYYENNYDFDEKRNDTLTKYTTEESMFSLLSDIQTKREEQSKNIFVKKENIRDLNSRWE